VLADEIPQLAVAQVLDVVKVFEVAGHESLPIARGDAAGVSAKT
jgi:hypothetical protein